MALLELRPNCECCDRDLPPQSRAAYMCSYECTFCEACVNDVLRGRCPNCHGELVRRPVRPEAGPAGGLAKHPASTKRKLKTGGCAPAAAA